MRDYSYAYRWDREYCYPESHVLINKLNIQDGDALHTAEREITSLRLAAAKMQPIKGKLDMKHLQKIHGYLFGDIYDLSFPILQFYYSDKTELLMEIESENKKKRPLSVSSLAVNGSDLLTMCASNHKRVGLILNRLLYLVIENPELNEKEQLLQIAMKLNKNEDF